MPSKAAVSQILIVSSLVTFSANLGVPVSIVPHCLSLIFLPMPSLVEVVAFVVKVKHRSGDSGSGDFWRVLEAGDAGDTGLFNMTLSQYLFQRFM